MLANGYSFFFLKRFSENVLKLDSGDVCTILIILKKHWVYTS